jgi:hypothetical protein
MGRVQNAASQLVHFCVLGICRCRYLATAVVYRIITYTSVSKNPKSCQYTIRRPATGPKATLSKYRASHFRRFGLIWDSRTKWRHANSSLHSDRCGALRIYCMASSAPPGCTKMRLHASSDSTSYSHATSLSVSIIQLFFTISVLAQWRE